jgi:hypothetical protein
MDASLHASNVAWVERRVTKRRITLRELTSAGLDLFNVACSENLQTEEESKSRNIKVALSSEQPHGGLHLGIQVLVVSSVLLV